MLLIAFNWVAVALAPYSTFAFSGPLGWKIVLFIIQVLSIATLCFAQRERRAEGTLSTSTRASLVLYAWAGILATLILLGTLTTNPSP